MIIAKLIISGVIGYTLGSIPFGFLVVKKMTGIDVREKGSRKLGTTNVLRVAGKKAAAIVFGLDLLKGSLAVIIAGLIFGREYLVVGDFAWGMLVAQVIAAVSAMLGHSWSMFLKFRGGGRGVATFFGGLAALFPPAALIGGEIFIIGAGLTRFVSLASIIAAVSTYLVLVPLTIINKFPLEYLIYALIGTIVILIMHRGNIHRLLAGTERKLGDKA
ncbi:MAG: glycerol-3-phosphate 1-O-acyltransferase PlsY [Dehalococcoidales bacterium]